MALALAADWCRHGLQGLLFGQPWRTVTTAPSRGTKYPPYLHLPVTASVFWAMNAKCAGI
jgi:hypothetical protein